MGQKVNPIGLRLKKTNKNYNSLWYGDLFYRESLAQDLLVNRYLEKIFRQIGYPLGEVGFAPLGKMVKILFPYLLPEISRGMRSNRLRLKKAARPSFDQPPKGGRLGAPSRNPQPVWSSPTSTKGVPWNPPFTGESFPHGKTVQNFDLGLNFRGLIKRVELNRVPLQKFEEWSFSSPKTLSSQKEERFAPIFFRGEGLVSMDWFDAVAKERGWFWEPPFSKGAAYADPFERAPSKGDVSAPFKNPPLTPYPIGVPPRPPFVTRLGEKEGVAQQTGLTQKGVRVRSEFTLFIGKKRGSPLPQKSPHPTEDFSDRFSQKKGGVGFPKRFLLGISLLFFSNQKWRHGNGIDPHSLLHLLRFHLSQLGEWLSLPELGKKGGVVTPMGLGVPPDQHRKVHFSNFPTSFDPKGLGVASNSGLPPRGAREEFSPPLSNPVTPVTPFVTSNEVRVIGVIGSKGEGDMRLPFPLQFPKKGGSSNLPLPLKRLGASKGLRSNLNSSPKRGGKGVTPMGYQTFPSFYNPSFLGSLRSACERICGDFIFLEGWRSFWDGGSPLYLAGEIAYYITRRVPFIRLKNQLLREILENRGRVWDSIEGIRICCSGRTGGRSKKAQRGKKESFQWGRTSLNLLSSRVGFARSTGLTLLGVVGIKVWICYK
jgi:hypothetical protein